MALLDDRNWGSRFIGGDSFGLAVRRGCVGRDRASGWAAWRVTGTGQYG